MAKLRLEITKGEAIRYVSHLDYARTLERTIRRAKLPMAYSEGFNPHMKVSYASALGVGIASRSEYMDMELTEEITTEEFSRRLSAQLPAGIELNKVKYVTQQAPSLMAIVNLATYEVKLPFSGDTSAMDKSLHVFNEAEGYQYIKESPKGKKEINIKPFLAEPISVTYVNQQAILELVIRITPQGSVKPAEVLDALANGFAMPANPEQALITRTGLFITDGKVRLTPFEVK